MIIILPLLLSIQIQAIGCEAGAASYLPKTGFGPKAGLFYMTDISEAFWMFSGISYWTKGYRSQEGMRERDCTFSDLSLYEDGMITKMFSDRLTVGAGAGISVHFLKNYVKERTHRGSFIITEYYTKAVNRFGLQLQLLAGFKIKNCFLALKGGYTTLLMNSQEENLFYQKGNIRTLSLVLTIIK